MSALLPWHETLAMVLMHFVWQACALAAVVELTVRLLRIERGTRQYVAYLIGFLVLAASPVVTAIYLSSAHVGSALSGAMPLSGVLDSRWTHELASAVCPYSIWIVSIWFAGFTALTLRTALGVWALHRIRIRLVPVPEEWVERARSIAKRFGVEARWTLRTSTLIREPMTFGWVRPVIVVPLSFFSSQPREIIDAVLAHELAHIRRYDLWINAIQRIVESLLFFHPVVWWMSRRIREERELCCDDMAVRTTGEPVAYATALERVASIRLAGPVAPLAVAMGARVLGYRVRRVLGIAEPNSTGFATPRLLAATAVAGAAIALVVSHDSPWFAERLAAVTGERTSEPPTKSKSSPEELESADGSNADSLVFATAIEPVSPPMERTVTAGPITAKSESPDRSNASHKLEDVDRVKVKRRSSLAAFDINQDGILDEQERRAIETAYARKMKERTQAMLAKHDTNKDGELDFREKAVAWAKYQKSRRSRCHRSNRSQGSNDKVAKNQDDRKNHSRSKRHEQWRERILAKYDADKNGKLDDAERKTLQVTWKDRRKQYWTAFVQRYDIDGNGKLDEHERMAIHLTRTRVSRTERDYPGRT